MIMNPNTGEILAEASYPNFDLNDPRDLSAFYTDEVWAAMSEEDQLNAMNDLWRNFCVSDAYEPGSTMKPFTIAAGLETGALSGDETYYCSGSKEIVGIPIGCANKEGHGTETVQDALAYSCNVALMDMGLAIGQDDFSRYQHIFGFGEYTGHRPPGRGVHSQALLYSAERYVRVSTWRPTAFGQNFNVTMTQLLSAYCSLINGGYYYEPHVVKQIQR